MHTNTDTHKVPPTARPERYHTPAYLRARTPKECQTYRKARTGR